MSNKMKTLFIINPISGYSNKEDIPALIKRGLDHDRFDYDIVMTAHRGHATALSEKAVNEAVDLVVACGGDGTVNEVAKAITNTESALGIIPNGSGNGFAMHIGMGRNTTKAIQKINKGTFEKVDTCKVNGAFFLNLAGIGFDALIAYKAENEKKRGFQMYATMVSREMVKFKAETFTIKTDDEVIHAPFSVVAVANAAMYGYNFTIAPTAKLQDGLLDIVFIKEASILRTLGASWRMLNNSLPKSPLVEIKKSKRVSISTDKPYYYHLDGEGYTFDEELHFEVDPMSLNLLVPDVNAL